MWTSSNIKNRIRSTTTKTIKVELEEIKKEMKKFTDLYGNPLLWNFAIDECKNLLDCEAIIERHREHLLDSANDASNHLDRFKEKILNNER